MSDFAPTTTPDAGGVPASGGAPPAPPAPAPASPPPTAAPAAGSDPLLDSDLPDQPLFDAGYVRDIRGRANNYRQQLREAEQARAAYQVFDQYDQADRQVWIDLASTWQTDPAQAAQVMQRIAASVLDEAGGEPDPEMSDPPPAGQATTDLTPEGVQRMIAEALYAQQQVQAEAQAVESVYAEVRGAGYDPDTVDGFMVLWIANHETEGNIAQAVEKLRARDAAVIDAYVQGKSANHAGVAPSNGAVATSAPAPPTSWDDTRRAAQAFLNGQMAPGQA